MTTARPDLPRAERIEALGARYGLDPDALGRLGRLLYLLVTDPSAPTSIRAVEAAVDDHLADSLVGVECGSLAEARSVLDLGTGAGLPGLPLAVALPDITFTLLESSRRKVAFLHRAVEVCRLTNTEVVHCRAESFVDSRGRYDVVTARAVAPLPVVLEYAAPLLRLGGTVIVWRGRREPELEAAALRAGAELGLGAPAIRPVRPFRGAAHRHLYAVSKRAETPLRFPRRPGMALKRPLGMAAAR
jgi:16S rRNA (guanine527-N7)-methyltransferase